MALLVATLWPCASLATPPPAEAFGGLPGMEFVTLSPSGRLLAWVDRSGTQDKIVAFDVQAKKDVAHLPIGEDQKVRDVRWADDAYLLVTYAFADSFDSRETAFEYRRTFSVNVWKSDPPRLLLMDSGRHAGVNFAVLVSTTSSKKDEVIMATLESTAAGTKVGLYGVDLPTGKSRVIETNSRFSTWVVDRAGQPVARDEGDFARKLYVIQAKRAGKWQEIHRQEDGWGKDLVGLTADGRSVLAVGGSLTSVTKLHSIALDGSGAEILVEDPVYDVEEVVFDPIDASPWYAMLSGPAENVRWLSKAAEQRQKVISKAFAGKESRVLSRSSDDRLLLIRAHAPSHPPDYYLVDLAAKSAELIGESHPRLVNVPLGHVSIFNYTARDGYPLMAYLTLPPGSDGKNLPTVVLLHDGLHGRASAEFDVIAQFLATRGYAVLQPQHRGSAGLGLAHGLAGEGEWGGLIRLDIDDGVNALVERGIADRWRIGIAGVGFGGYNALAGVLLTPRLYACAISVNGISDLPTMLGMLRRQSGDRSVRVDNWMRAVGKVGDAKLAERSPMQRANEISVPVLLFHGEENSVIPINQSQMMERQMKAAGKQVKFVRLEGEDHWLSRASTRTQVLKDVEDFIAANLGPRASSGTQ